MVYISLQAPCPLSASTDHRKLYCGFLLPPKGDCNRIGRLTALRGQRKTGRRGARRLSARLGYYSTAILKPGCEPQFSRRVRGYSAAFGVTPFRHPPYGGRRTTPPPEGEAGPHRPSVRTGTPPPTGEARPHRPCGAHPSPPRRGRQERGGALDAEATCFPLRGKWPKADRSCFPLRGKWPKADRSCFPLRGKWPKADRSCFPPGGSGRRPIDLASPSGGSAAKRR